MHLVTALLLYAMSNVTNIEWTERRPMPRAQAGGAAAYLNGELVVAGGTTWEADVKVWLSDVQIYEPVSNRWAPGPKLPVPLAYGPFVSSGEGLEIFGGTGGKTVHRTSWRLDQRKTKWQQTGSVPADVLLGRAARVGESVFLFGGCHDVADLTGCSDAVWRRDGKGEWRSAGEIPGGALALPAIAASGSAIYLFGGCSMTAAGKVVNHARAYRYDSVSNHWTRIRDLPAGNRGLSAVAYGARSIYLFGGYTDSGFTADVLQYDTEADTYRPLKPMPVGLAGIEFVLNGRILYGAGGEDRMRSRSARLFEGTLAVSER
jgi:N-acetylneuraminate epimerase